MRIFRFFCRLVSCTLIAGIVTLSPLASFTVHASPPSSSLVIGEVAWAGSSLSTADEWLEIWNVGDEPAPLAGWSLRGASDATSISFPADAMIPPHGLFLVSNYAMGDAKSVLATTTHLVTTAVSLSNSKLKIELVDPAGFTVDTAGTGGTPLAGASLPIKMTMIRIDPLLDGAGTNAWTAATTTIGMKPGVTDLGTPGLCDNCGTMTVVAEPEPVPTTEPDVTTTTTDDVLLPDPSSTTSSDIATTTVDMETPTSTTETPAIIVAASMPPVLSQTTTATTIPSDKPKPNYGMLRLNEAAPYPSSGNEWVEIVTLDAATPINLKGCEIHDANGRILIIGSKNLDPTASRYMKIPLTKSKLNNSGDSVSLYAPDQRLLDTMKYAATKKNEVWIRFPDLNGDWQKTASSTPGAPNILTQPLSRAADVAAAPSDTTTQTTSTDEAVSAENDSITSLETTTILGETTVEENADVTEPTTTKSTKKTASTARTTAKKTTAKTKTSNTSNVQLIHPISFDMLTQEIFADMRIRITGRVGTRPGLVASHSFILQNPDGRGLIVSVPTKLRLPLFDNDVSVIGSLRIDDKGVASIKMMAKDTWLRVPTSAVSVAPRVVDLLAPSAEDAWSLVSVTGTVMTVSGSTVHLDLADAEVDVLIKPLTKYRPKRLMVGDVITVAGLLDTSRDDPRILPRLAEDITIVKHAPPKNETLATADIPPRGPLVPGWAPFGAAVGAIGVTEGAKRLHRRRKLRTLEKKLAAM